MTVTGMLTKLKQSLGEPNASDDREEFLSFKIESAISLLTENGVILEPEETTEDEETVYDYPIADSNLIVMYADHLVRNRATEGGIPRELEWAIHNRIMRQVQDEVDAESEDEEE